jgi:predicted MFS family arabinose efflux permease
MSIRQTAVPLGGALGALVLPALARGPGFQWVYGVLAAACLLSTWLTWQWLVEPPDAHSPKRAMGSPRALPNPLARASIWRMALGIGLLCAPQFAILSFASIYLHDSAHAGWAGISLTLCVIQVGAMVLRIWSGHRTDRTGDRPHWLRRSTLWAGASFLPLAAFAAATTHGSAWLAMATVALAGIAVSAWHGVAYAELASRAGAEKAGTALGLANTLVFLSYFFTPLALPHAQGVVGWGGIWLLAGIVAIVTWPLFRR